MNNFEDFKRKFSNHRQWREFVSVLHESVTHPCSITYPRVIAALRSGRALFNDGAVRFNDGAVRATSWLSGQAGVQEILNLGRTKA